jgi:chromosome segregation protein
VWWRGDGQAAPQFVSLTLIADDGTETEIRRTPQGLESPNTQENLDHLLCDPSRSPETPIRLLLQTAIIRDEEITRLSIDLPETQRFQFVRAAVGEADLSVYAEPLGAVCSELRQIAERSEKEYTQSRESVARLLEEIATKRAAVASEQDLAAAEEALRNRFERKLELHDLLREARSEVVEFRYRIKQLEEASETLFVLEGEEKIILSPAFEKESEDLAEAVKVAEGELTEAQIVREAAKGRMQAVAGRHAETAAWAQLLHHGAHLGLQDGHCPLCGSSLDEKSFEAHLEELRRNISETDREASEFAIAEAKAVELEARAQQHLHDAVQALTDHQRRTPRLRDRRESLRNELVRLKAPVASWSELQALLESVRSDVRATERAMLVVESSTVIEELRELEGALDQARAEAADAQRRTAEAGRALERAKQSLDSVRRIEGEIIEERLSALGPLLEELYTRLKPHLDWTKVRYHIRGDVKKFLSIKVGDELNPRFMFSSGQRRALGIAFLLAAYLSTDWTRLQTLLLDDPVQHIDDFRALHLVELFTALRAANRQIICTVEDPDLAELMVRRLRGLGDEVGASVSLEYVPGIGTRVTDYRIVRPSENRVMESA